MNNETPRQLRSLEDIESEQKCPDAWLVRPGKSVELGHVRKLNNPRC